MIEQEPLHEGVGARDANPADTLVVIAAYREAAVVAAVVAGLRRCGPRVVVVDDGSDDETAAVAAAAGATVLRHPVNLGQGAALRTGFAFALERTTARYVVTFDADGQHDPADVGRLVAPLADNRADVTLGSRFLDGTGYRAMPASRRVLLRAATALARRTTGLALTDTHNGLRGFRRDALTGLVLRQDRMAHASELQHEIARLGLRYLEVPVRIQYTSYSLAKGQRVTDAISILWDLLIVKTR